MKKFVLATVGIFFALSMFAKDIQELVLTTNPPMSCQNCENKIKKGDVRFVKGVKKIETSLKDQRVTIEYDADQTNPEQIENAFHKIGYQVEVINCDGESATSCATDQSEAAAGACCGSKCE